MFQGCCKSFFFVVSVDLLLTIFFLLFNQIFGAGTVLGGVNPRGGGASAFIWRGLLIGRLDITSCRTHCF